MLFLHGFIHVDTVLGQVYFSNIFGIAPDLNMQTLRIDVKSTPSLNLPLAESQVMMRYDCFIMHSNTDGDHMPELKGHQPIG